ncbi:MAG: hypothetical protein ABI383_09205 [Acidobacteriaceae bacterium]
MQNAPNASTSAPPASAVSNVEPARSGFTLTRTELDVSLHQVDHAAEVSGKLTLRNDQSVALRQVYLQLTSTSKWLAVKREGTKLEFTEHQVKSDADHTGIVNEARIHFDHPLPAHATAELEVRYTLTVARSSGRLRELGAPLDAALATDWDRIAEVFVGVRGVGYVVWYPVALAPGSLQEGNSVFEAVAEWKAREAASTFIVRVVNGERHGDKTYGPLGMAVPVLTGVAAPTLVRNGVSIVANSAIAAEAMAFTNDSQQFARQWLPQVRATAKLWQLPEAGDVPYASGNEAFVPSNLPAQDTQSVTLYAVSHAALASPRPWIQEGYAAFLDAQYREHARGREAALKFLADRRGALALTEPQPENVTSEASSLIESPEESRYRTKAMFVWWMLKDIVSEAALQKAIKAYKGEQDRSPDYMQKLIEAQSHKDLNWFFNDWVYRDRGLAELSIAAAVPRQTVEGKWVTEVTVANDGGAGASVPVFVTAGPIEEQGRVVVPAHAKASVQVMTNLKPTHVRVNDGSVPETDMNDNDLAIK